MLPYCAHTEDSHSRGDTGQLRLEEEAKPGKPGGLCLFPVRERSKGLSLSGSLILRDRTPQPKRLPEPEVKGEKQQEEPTVDPTRQRP